MKIGFLILCHTDPEHIGRLARRLSRTEDSFVWTHVDGKVEAEPFRRAAAGLSRVSRVSGGAALPAVRCGMRVSRHQRTSLFSSSVSLK